MKSILYVVFALIAFAGNSVFCRWALGQGFIDPASFTSIRLVSGATILALLVIVFPFNKSASKDQQQSQKGSWKAAFTLFIYAAAFSYAYIDLETGVGALVLFGAVQLTMITISYLKGQKLVLFEWLGVLLAFSGFVYLVFPELSKPSFVGFVLMTISGIAWAFYTLLGKGVTNPLAETNWNFLRSLPFVFILVLFTFDSAQLTEQGVMLALGSGMLTSAVGYAIWYQALKSLSAIQAGVVQLFVPVIAAFGGVVFVDESISIRLVISSLLVLGGILLVIFSKPLTQSLPLKIR